MSSRSLDDLHDDSDLDEYDDSDDDEELRLAQEEWDESVAQLQLLVSVVAMPWFGKWLGRRWSRWGTCYLLTRVPVEMLMVSFP
jgi:hypothetical protein